ncbi:MULTISPECIES: pyridoxal-dependent aspartate 1-decarboxylase PanP [unclassified Pseudoalteromonas]|uniref:pyridoxal-dependent aspartate 1-decarboxylase PanP n=1 Tax=unclassified Pseudoalteromonas TaxID=194690 RepID=UPI002096BD9A|nr:putative pyridoxal-dependent aspartate 1-decarboxylase [Pseudoalteromonas sp. XMcav2-N]MCO7191004.1 putative pyridoxal-dependent aspartate 1-decarboxylase [Pseudoalteromonas sp. XMcav2-N]
MMDSLAELSYSSTEQDSAIKKYQESYTEPTDIREEVIRLFHDQMGETSYALYGLEKALQGDLNAFLNTQIRADKTMSEIELEHLDFDIPVMPRNSTEHADEIVSKLVANSVNTSSPLFIGHMTSALPRFSLSLAKLNALLNQNVVKVETSRGFTSLERQVLGMIHKLVYQQEDCFYKQTLHDPKLSLGSFCSGGTLGNLTALWVARNQLLGACSSAIRDIGLPAALQRANISGLNVISSRCGHYSLKKAADILGVGRQNLLKATGPCGRTDPDTVFKIATERMRAGEKTLAIIGIAGFTENGMVDPLDELAEVASEIGCHFHVDAAWGGATLFSKQHRHLFNGIERADSVTIDAHKQMYVPMGVGVVLFKNEMSSNVIRQNARYILRDGSRDIGATTVEGSRANMALQVYSIFQLMGSRGIAWLVDNSIEMAKRFSRMIGDRADFEVVTQPTLCILTYRVIPQSIQRLLADSTLCVDKRAAIESRLDDLVHFVQRTQRENGRSFVSRTRIQKHEGEQGSVAVFRVVLANPLTEEEHLHSILDEQLQIAKSSTLWQNLLMLEFD